MSKGSWRRSKSKHIPDNKIQEEWDRLFPKKTTGESHEEEAKENKKAS